MKRPVGTELWDIFAGIVVFLFFLWLLTRGGQAITEIVGAHQ